MMRIDFKYLVFSSAPGFYLIDRNPKQLSVIHHYLWRISACYRIYQYTKNLLPGQENYIYCCYVFQITEKEL